MMDYKEWVKKTEKHLWNMKEETNADTLSISGSYPVDQSEDYKLVVTFKLIKRDED